MTNPYASRSLNLDEPVVALTGGCAVPQSRAAEWFRGTRPLDGMDADFYFRSSVAIGLITEQEVVELKQRHYQLCRREEAVAKGAVVCKSCHGSPPAGFACRTCGAEG